MSNNPVKPLCGRTSSQILLYGVVRLLEGQRCFAEEFGISLQQLFSNECQEFRYRNPRAVIQEWILDTENGPRKFNTLMLGLIQHYLALHAALDGIAHESLNQLSPANVKAQSLSIFGWHPFAWLTYRRLHRAYSQNAYLRHHECVVKGFVSAYSSYINEITDEKNYQTQQETSN